MYDKPQISFQLTAHFKKVSGDEYRAHQNKIYEAQDEKNTHIDALDGEVSKIPKADSQAYAAYEGSRRDRLDQKKKKDLRYILFMINQHNKNIEQSFSVISDIMENLTILTDKILTSINDLLIEIETMKTDHSEAQYWMDNYQDKTIKLEDVINPKILNIIKRYNNRNESEQNETINLRKAIKDQIDYEQEVILPQLQDKIQGLGQLYEQAGQGADKIRSDLDSIELSYDSINKLENDENKILLLEEVEANAKILKEQAEQLEIDLNEKFNVVRNGYASDIDEKHADDKILEKANFKIDLKPFGL